MGKRGSGHSSSRIAQSAQTRAILQGDYPPALKAEMLLAVRGGRQRPRRCLGCGKPGIHADIFVTHESLKVGTHPDRKGFLRYWTCDTCHQQGLTPELEQTLREGLSR